MRCCRPQVCQAHRADGGRVVVVMSQREKLDMESLYRCEGCYLNSGLGINIYMQDAFLLVYACTSAAVGVCCPALGQRGTAPQPAEQRQ